MAHAFTSESTVVQIAASMLVIAGLYWAQDVLVPLAIAILLSFMLTPVADGLERLHLPRIASLALIVVLILMLLAGVGSLMVSQTYSLANSLPKYRQNIEQRLHSLYGSGPGVFKRAASTVKKSRKQASKESEQQKQATEPAPEHDKLMQVEIHQSPPTGFELLKTYAAPIVGPIGQAALVLVFLVFMLLQREDLRDRMIRLMGQDRLDVTTRAFDDAGSRISRYLLAELIINVTYAVPVALGLWLIGLPGALLWGVLAGLWRFIPFLGPWMGASLPVLLSLAIFDGWHWPLAVVGLFVVLELFTGNVLEPWLYSSSTGMTPVGVILALVFWGALWGLVGVVLAIPLTVCLVVAGRHLPQFRFFTILLSRDSPLTPSERFYQRLLAGDQDEIEDLASDYVEAHGLVQLYDRLMVPALHLAERSRHARHLEGAEMRRILQGMTAIVEDMGEQQRTRDAQQQHSDRQSGTQGDYVVLCLPARDKADELSALMFAQILRSLGLTAETGSAHALVGETVTRVDTTAASLVCLSALPPGAVNHARYLCRRLAERSARVPVMVGLWNASGNFERMSARLTDAGAERVYTTFEDGADYVRRRLSGLPRIAD